MARPNFFIVGAPKCGTTSIDQYLRSHPDIGMAAVKEPHYFGADLPNTRSLYRNDETRYLSLFDGLEGKKHIGETSVWYLYSQQAANEIKRFAPDAKIVIMLRNPVDLMYSLHSQYVYTGAESVTDFEQALAAEESRKTGRGVIPAESPFPQALYYRDVVRFAPQVKRYLDAFTEDNVLTLFFEEFKTNTDATFRALLQFIGVTPDAAIDYRRYNENKSVRSRIVQQWLRRPPAFLRRVARFGPLNTPAKVAFRLLKRANAKVESRPPIAPALRERLLRELSGEIEELSKLLDKSLEFWN